MFPTNRFTSSNGTLEKATQSKQPLNKTKLEKSLDLERTTKWLKENNNKLREKPNKADKIYTICLPKNLFNRIEIDLNVELMRNSFRSTIFLALNSNPSKLFIRFQILLFPFFFFFSFFVSFTVVRCVFVRIYFLSIIN